MEERAKLISLKLPGSPTPAGTPGGRLAGLALPEVWGELEVPQTPHPCPLPSQRRQEDVGALRQWWRKQLWLRFPSAPWRIGGAHKRGPDLALGST